MRERTYKQTERGEIATTMATIFTSMLSLMRKRKGRNFHPFIVAAAATVTAGVLAEECKGREKGEWYKQEKNRDDESCVHSPILPKDVEVKRTKEVGG